MKANQADRHIMRRLTLPLILLIFGVLPAFSEDLYPSGYSIDCQYIMSDSEVYIGDTLIITRSFANNESFGLDAFYISENLPPEFTIASYTLQVDGFDQDHMFLGPLEGHEVEGYMNYAWVMDSPHPEEPFSFTVDGGSLVVLQIKIISSDIIPLCNGKDFILFRYNA